MLTPAFLELLTKVHHDTGFLSSDLRQAHGDAPESDPALEIVLYGLLERAAALHNDVNRLVQPYLRLGEQAATVARQAEGMKAFAHAVSQPAPVVESATEAHDRRMAEGRALLATLDAALLLKRLDAALHFRAESLKELDAARDLLEPVGDGPNGFRGELCAAMDEALKAHAALGDADESLTQVAGVLRSIRAQEAPQAQQ